MIILIKGSKQFNINIKKKGVKNEIIRLINIM